MDMAEINCRKKFVLVPKCLKLNNLYWLFIILLFLGEDSEMEVAWMLFPLMSLIPTLTNNILGHFT